MRKDELLIRFSSILDSICIFSLSILFLSGAYSKRAVKVCLGVAFLCWLAKKIIIHRRRFLKNLSPKTFLSFPVLFFLVACIVSVLFSTNIRHSQSVFFERYFLYFILFFMVVDLASSRRNFRVLVSVLCLGIFIIAIGVLRDFLIFSGQHRLLTSFGKPIGTNFFIPMALPIFLCMSIFSSYSKKIKLVFGIITAILALALFLSFSRASFISIFAVLIFMGFFGVRSERRKLYFALFLIFIFVGTGISLSTEFGRRHFIGKGATDSALFGFRVPLWTGAINIGRTRPLIGKGLGTCEFYLADNVPGLKDYIYTEKIQAEYLHAHSTYLELFAETGLLGLFAFFWLWIVFIKNALKALSKGYHNNIYFIFLGLFSGVLATLIFEMASSNILVGVQGPTIFWGVTGLAVAVSRRIGT